MSRFVSSAVFGRSRLCLLGAAAALSLAPTPAPAFFQQTKLEGTVGTDIGGVWLSVQQLMPEFRITFQKPANGAGLPIDVAPIPASLEPLTGKNASGVVISDCGSGSFCSENGLLVGDILVKLGPNEVTDVASFKKAQEDLPPSVLLSVRRPALKNTTARLFKINYTATGQEAPGSGVEQIGQEKLDVRVLDVVLPFEAALDATRSSHEVYQPAAADLDALKQKWSELATRQPERFINGNHRFVAKSDFDESLSGDKNLADAKFAMLLEMEGNPTQGAGAKVIDVYGLEQVSPTEIEGTYVSVTMASAPFPVNIEFKGRFRMTRIADWSDKDDQYRAEHMPKKPKEDLSKYKTLPDVPPPAKTAKPAAPAKPSGKEK